ncbi:hypothetical protein ACQ5ES_11565 [Pseudidiomarina sp. E22-M8]
MSDKTTRNLSRNTAEVPEVVGVGVDIDRYDHLIAGDNHQPAL